MKSPKGSLHLYGIRPVRDALRSETCSVRKLLICRGRKNRVLAEIRREALGRGIEVAEIERSALEKKFGIGYHQGVVGILSGYRYVPVEELVRRAFQKSPAPVIAILDGVTDPGNLGGVIRSAEAFGVEGIIIPKNRSAAVTPTVFKRSAGAASRLTVSRVASLSQALEFLKRNKFWLMGTDAKAGSTVWECDLQGPLAVVFGSESRGLGRLVSRRCDYLVSIPMQGKAQSLNVASAAAVFFYEIMRRRRFGPQAG